MSEKWQAALWDRNRGFGEAGVAGFSVGREEVEEELGMARLIDLRAVVSNLFWHQGTVLL